MTVQDDERERELCRLFNLSWDSAHQRGGTDAFFSIDVYGDRYHVPVEVKSTTRETIATARDVGMDHIAKWKKVMWIIGFYTQSRRPELIRMLCLTPADMSPWISEIEEKIGPDFLLAKLASHRLTLNDLYEICGQKEHYKVADAKRLHKMQWSSEQYQAARDILVGGEMMISPQKMLDILKLRAEYIANRGATLNNPHITKTFLATFANTDRAVAQNGEPAVRVREITRNYIATAPTHPFIGQPLGQ
ncbi:MAG: hypothetical protein WC722_09945 [Rhodospirillales bacterium]